MPRSTNVVVAPRAPESSTGTFLKSSATNSRAFCIVAVRLLQRVAPGGEIVPARATRCLRVRRDDLDARLDRSLQSLIALRIALADEEDNRRRVRRSVLRQPLLPVRRDQTACRDGIDVIGERQRDDVGFQTVDDGSSPARPIRRATA